MKNETGKDTMSTIEDEECLRRFLMDNLKGEECLKNLGVGGRIILILDLKE